MTNKHKLTAHKDHITGGAGKDLFTGSKGQLGSNDVLDGRGGNDIISAVLTETLTTPVLKSIEKGSFTASSTSNVILDLSHAAKMKQVTLHDLGYDDSSNIDVSVVNAAHVSSLILRNVYSEGDISVSGIDAAAVGTERLLFDGFTDKTLTLNTQGHAAFKALDITLKGAYYEELAGDVAAKSIVIHSLKTPSLSSNYISIAPTGGHDTQSVTVTGSADLVLELDKSGFNRLERFDASHLSAGARTWLSSHDLRSVLGGAGNDELHLEAIGGSKAKAATVSLGRGDDLLDVWSLKLNASTMHFEGGKGYDTILVHGSPKNIGLLQGGFEMLQVSEATGTYHLGSGWKGFSFADAASSGKNVVIQDSSGLTSVKGSFSDDQFRLDELGGSVKHKAIVDLDSGNDFISLYHMTLNAKTQSFLGGDGSDGFDISGNVADLGALFQGFDYAYLYNATGTYDLSDSGIHNLIIVNSSGVMTFDHVVSGSMTQLLANHDTLMTVNVLDAAKLSTDLYRVELYGDATLGNNLFGFDSAGLSNLEVYGDGKAHTFYLTQLGGPSDAATVEIMGNSKVTMVATTGSTNYIDTINVTNTMGFDMSNLTKALVSTGVVIEGGAGNDVLVGGNGGDTISSAGGDNQIHGSLGIDVIDLSNGALDTLGFHAQNQSAFDSGDVCTGFNLFDGLDLSDIVSSVTFGGNVASFGAGLGKLSSSHAVAFFQTDNHTLYVDVNHDGSLSAGSDMEFHFNDLNSFAATSLL